MKRNTVRVTMAILLGATFLSVAPAMRAQECSNASVAGKWGFTTNGTVVGVGPRASLGIFTLDGAGKFLNGKATASLNGIITEETASGTYAVNPDCTGKLVIVISDLLGNKLLSATLDVVFDDNLRHLRALYTSVVLANNTPLETVITADGKRLFPEN